MKLTITISNVTIKCFTRFRKSEIQRAQQILIFTERKNGTRAENLMQHKKKSFFFQ